jgi:hypothetical protein
MAHLLREDGHSAVGNEILLQLEIRREGRREGGQVVNSKALP